MSDVSSNKDNQKEGKLIDIEVNSQGQNSSLACQWTMENEDNEQKIKESGCERIPNSGTLVLEATMKL